MTATALDAERAQHADAARLAKRLAADTNGEVLFDAASRGRYATDASIYQSCRWASSCRARRPTSLPRSTSRETGTPLLPRGGGTSQCGQTTGAALVIDSSKHLRQLLSVDKDAMTAEVEPGLVLDHLNAELKPHGLWYPVDVSTSAQATLGGMAGNNSLRLPQHRLRQHGAQRARHRRLAERRQLRARSGRWRSSARRSAPIADFVRGLAETAPRRDRGALAQGAAPRRRLQPRHLRPAERAALHRTTAASTWRTCWSAPKARSR